MWDEEDRIRSIHDNGRTTEFVYDAEGDRVFKVGAQGETAYVNNFWTVRNRTVGTKHVFVGTTRIASKLSPGEAPIADTDPWMVTLGRWHLHRSDSGRDHASNTTMNPHYRVGTMMPRGGLAEDNFVYFYHPDHLGSTSYVTDPDGELYEHVEYFPSGEPWVTEQTNTERLPYLFSSKELDQETGLYDFGARQYDPRVGVFLSVEPALQGAFFERDAPGGGVYFPVQLSAYAYGNHSPLVFVDPNGEWGMLVVAVAMVALMPVLMSGPDVAEGPQAAATTVLAARGGGPAAVMAATPYIMSGDDVAAAPQAVMVAGGGAQVARDLRNVAAMRRATRQRQSGAASETVTAADEGAAAASTSRTATTRTEAAASSAASAARHRAALTLEARLSQGRIRVQGAALEPGAAGRAAVFDTRTRMLHVGEGGIHVDVAQRARLPLDPNRLVSGFVRVTERGKIVWQSAGAMSSFPGPYGGAALDMIRGLGIRAE